MGFLEKFTDRGEYVPVVLPEMATTGDFLVVKNLPENYFKDMWGQIDEVWYTMSERYSWLDLKLAKGDYFKDTDYVNLTKANDQDAGEINYGLFIDQVEPYRLNLPYYGRLPKDLRYQGTLYSKKDSGAATTRRIDKKTEPYNLFYADYEDGTGNLLGVNVWNGTGENSVDGEIEVWTGKKLDTDDIEIKPIRLDKRKSQLTGRRYKPTREDRRRARDEAQRQMDEDKKWR